jgi:gentisate 1,2-dioxygenase
MDSTTFYPSKRPRPSVRVYARLKTQNAAPLWEVLGDLVRSDPRTAFS